MIAVMEFVTVQVHNGKQEIEANRLCETGKTELNIILNGCKRIIIEMIGQFLVKLKGFTQCLMGSVTPCGQIIKNSNTKQI